MSDDCPFCRDVDHVCPIHGPARPAARATAAALLGEVIMLRNRVENLEVMLRDVWERVGILEDKERRSREP